MKSKMHGKGEGKGKLREHSFCKLDGGFERTHRGRVSL